MKKGDNIFFHITVINLIQKFKRIEKLEQDLFIY